MFANNNAELSIDNSLAAPVVVLSGDVTTGAEDLIMSSFQNLFEQGDPLIGIELKNSEYINSGGLRILIRIMKESELRGVRVIFIAPSDYYLNVFHVMGIDAILYSAESRDDFSRMVSGIA